VDAILQPERILHMKAKHFWLASVLVALSAFSTVHAADDVVIHATSESCPSCEGGSKFHFGGGLSIFHRPSSCSACGDHAWINWRPGQYIGEIHDSASAKLHALGDFHFPAPTCAGAKNNQQPIMPQYIYNPYYRSPRDYFMSEH
jgi:hypothetical protein